LTAREAAGLMGVHERTIRRAIARGELPATKRGGMFRIAWDDLARHRAIRPARSPGPHPGQPAVPLAQRARDPSGEIRPRPPILGREREIAAILALIRREDVPLVTLTGPGGIGKTRLARDIVARAGPVVPDGAWFVDLTPLRDPALVPAAIAQAFGVRDTGDGTVGERLAAVVGARQILLVLDNCEQVVDATPDIGALLDACPRLTVLATSRVPLRLSMEQLFPVPPLPVPGRDRPRDPATVGESPAVMLFCRKARAVRPGFELTDGNAAAVAGICARLDGLPLAIELAAARSSVLSPEALFGRLDQALPLLTDGPHDAPPRLRSMREAIAWSYDLLDANEQTVFRHLAVFAGGFTAEGAGVVAFPSGHPPAEVLATLTSLVERSLVTVTGEPEGQPRFGMLETIREFGMAELERHGELADAEQGRARWLLELTRWSDNSWDSYRNLRWTRQLEPEHDNLRATLAFLMETDDRETYVRLASQLGKYWFASNRWEEGSTMLRPAQAWSVGQRTPERLRLLVGSGQIWLWRGDETSAIEFLEEALGFGADMPDEIRFACQMGLAIAAMIRGEHDRATQWHTRTLALLDAMDDADPRAIAEARSVIWANQGFVELGRDAIDRAEALATAALATQRELGLESTLCVALSLAAQVAIAKGNPGVAIQRLRESLRLGLQYRDLQTIAGVFTVFANLHLEAGHPDRAARLLGAVDHLRTMLGGYPADRLPVLAELTDSVRSSLGDQAFTVEWDIGCQLPIEDAIAFASAVEAPPPLASHRNPWGITRRELDVLCLMAEGHTDQEIADALYVSRRTVNNHVSHLLAKLDAPNRRKAIVRAEAEQMLSSCTVRRNRRP